MSTYCKWCQITFNTESQLENHLRQPAIKHPFHCTRCSYTFETLTQLKNHYRTSSLHDEDDVYEMMTDVASYCVPCRRQFNGSGQLDTHSDRFHGGQWGSPSSSFSCDVCDKEFSSERSLQQHIASPVHNERDIACPHCNSYFKTTSGVAHHLECRCLEQITEGIIRWDVNSQITNPALNPRLITDANRFQEVDDDYYSGDDTVIRQNSREGITQIIDVIATEAAYDVLYDAYVCPVDDCFRQFKKLSHLNQHLGSPYHRTDPDTFRCPKCESKFSVVSALIQHLETGICGLVSQHGVQTIYSGMVGTFNRLLGF